MKNYDIAKWVIDEIIVSDRIKVVGITPSGCLHDINRFDMLCEWVEKWYMEGLITQEEYEMLIEQIGRREKNEGEK